MRHYLLLLLLTLLTTQARSQAVSLAGKVVDKDQHPLANCAIILAEISGSNTQETSSDSDGIFVFSAIAKGTYFVTIFKEGFTSHLSKVISIDSTFTLPAIILETNQLNTITVTASKKLFEMQSDKMVMNVENSILAAGNSVFEVIKKAPAVSADKDDNLLLKGSSCSIYIDGKPSYLRGVQLTAYLKSLPADAISKIEFITNPSGKFDAEGSGGIINIRFKKNKAKGLNGTATCGLGYGRYPKENAGMNINYRTGAINIFGNAYGGHSESYNQLTYNTSIANSGQLNYQDRSQYWHPFASWGSYMAGIDISTGKHSTLGVLINGNADATQAQTDNNTTISDADRRAEQYIQVMRKDTTGTTNTTYNINFKTQIDSVGSELSIDADYGRYRSKSASYNESMFLDTARKSTRDPYIFQNNQPAYITIQSFKADYSDIFKNKVKIEGGIKYSNVQTDNNLLADSMQHTAWVRDNNRTNHFIYIETIIAGYVTFSKEWKHTTMQAGLRTEYTNSNGRSVTLNTEQKRIYTNLFPSLFITHTLNADHQLNISYTRRIQRPAYQSLNPFTYYIDPYTLFAGNPYLKPAYINAFEIKHAYKQSLFVSAGYNHTTADVIQAVFQNKVTGITTNISQNAASSDYVLLSGALSLDPVKIWNTNLNISVSYGRNYSTIPGFSFRNTAFSADISSDHTISLPRNYKLQTNVYYSIPTRMGITHVRSDYGGDLGIQKQILNKNGTIKLNATNIIGISAYRARILNEELNIQWINKWEGRKASLSFTWKFGNNNIKANQTHTTSSQEERNRIK